MGRIIVNKHIPSKNIETIKNKFTDRTYGEGKQAREGEIVIVNDVNNPSIAIMDTEGGVHFISENTTSETVNIETANGTLENKYSASGKYIGTDVKVKNDENNTLKIDSDGKGLYVDNSEINKRIDDVESGIYYNNDKINDLYTEIDRVDHEKSDMSDEISSIESATKDISDRASVLESRADQIDLNVENNTTEINKINEKIGNIEGSDIDLNIINELSKNVKTNSENISNIATDVKKNSGDIKNLGDNFTELKTEVNNVKNDAEKALNDAKGYDDRIDSLETIVGTSINPSEENLLNRIDVLEESTDNLNITSTENKDAIEVLKTSKANRNEFDELKAKTNEIKEDNKKISSDINSIKNNDKWNISTIDLNGDSKYIKFDRKKYYDTDGKLDTKQYGGEIKAIVCDIDKSLNPTDKNDAVDGLARSLDVKNKISVIENYTINSKKISDNPTLDGSSINISKQYGTIPVDNNKSGDENSIGYNEKIVTSDNFDRAIKKLETALWSSMFSVSGALNDLNNRLEMPLVNIVLSDEEVKLKPYKLYNITTMLLNFNKPIVLEEYPKNTVDEQSTDKGNSVIYTSKNLAPSYNIEFVYTGCDITKLIKYYEVSIEDKDGTISKKEYIEKIHWKDYKLENGHKYLIKIINDLGEVIDFGKN